MQNKPTQMTDRHTRQARMTTANLPSNLSPTRAATRRPGCRSEEPARRAGRQKQEASGRACPAGARPTVLAAFAILVVICSSAFSRAQANNNKLELELELFELELDEGTQQQQLAAAAAQEREEANKAPLSPPPPPQLAGAASAAATTTERPLPTSGSQFDLDSGQGESYSNQPARQQQNRGHREQVLCEPSTEFRCQLDNRCVPIEWHCDFAEQCLDGEDELGCAPEWCNFEHGLCNWRNEPSLALGSLPGIWRRLGTHNWSPSSISQLQSSLALPESTGRPTTQPQQADNQSLALRELLKLAGSADSQQSSRRFLFVPLTLSKPRRGNNSQRASIASVEQSVSAHFKSPVISQTDSMCQVRFKYALWSAPIQAASSSAGRQRPQRLSEGATWPRVRLNLSLIARQRLAGGSETRRAAPSALEGAGAGLALNRSAGGGAEQPKGSNNNIPSSKILWSKSIEAPVHVSQAGSDGQAAPESQLGTAGSSVEWLLGVAELGHLRQIELDFEAEASLVWPEQPGRGAARAEGDESRASSEIGDLSWKVPGAGGAKSAPTFARPSGSGQQQQQQRQWHWARHDSLAALDWVKFQGCSWPRLQLGAGHGAAPSAGARGSSGSTDQWSWAGLAGPEGWRPSAQGQEVAAALEEQQQQEGEGEDLGAELAGPSEQAGRNLVSACEERDFHCSASNICLPEHKLCNFVNDCMESASDDDDDDKLAQHYTYTNANGQQLEAGCSSWAPAAELGEDELPDMCQPVAGMESFEAHTQSPPAQATAQRGSTGGVGEPSDGKQTERQVVSKFWSLSGNWPQNRIALERAAATIGRSAEPSTSQSDRHDDNNSNVGQRGSRAHLPSRDHTLAGAASAGGGGGHYLSFEIPGVAETPELALELSASVDNKHHSNNSGRPRAAAANNKSASPSKPAKTTFWAYLNSPWMEKLANETGDCRAKLFYNVVSSSRAFSLDYASHNLPHKLYLTVEHFVATTDTGVRQRRVIDSFAHSHQLDWDGFASQAKGESCAGPIEYPGVDFWREVNVKLAGLSEGDLFYIRIGVFVELSDVAGANSRATINIDDLSTHFGCAPVDVESDADEKSSHRMEAKRNIAKVRQNVSFDLSDFIFGSQREDQRVKQPQHDHAYHYSQWKRRPKFDDYGKLDASRSGNEPHKLIICVFGVLFAIIGIILAIVFLLVPYVERITISYHDQISVGLSEIMRNPQVDSGDGGLGFASAAGVGGGDRASSNNAIRASRSGYNDNTQQATTNLSGGSDSSSNKSSRSSGSSRSPNALMIEACELTTESDWEQISRQWRQSAISESFMTDSVVTILDSQSYSQRIDSLEYLPPISFAPAPVTVSTSKTPFESVTEADAAANFSDLDETVSRTIASQQQQVLAATSTATTTTTTTTASTTGDANKH